MALPIVINWVSPFSFLVTSGVFLDFYCVCVFFFFFFFFFFANRIATLRWDGNIWGYKLFAYVPLIGRQAYIG